MMESAKDGFCNDVTKPVDRTRKRRVLSQSEMRPDIAAIGGVGLEDLAQVGLAKDHDVKQTFSARYRPHDCTGTSSKSGPTRADAWPFT
jgi:hypothetical protein